MFFLNYADIACLVSFWWGGRERDGRRVGEREGGVETFVSKFILHHRRSAFRKIPSRLKESRPSQSHAVLRIRRKRCVRSSIS